MIQFSWPYDVSMSLHARKMKKSWIFEKRYSNDFDIIRCNISYMTSFLVENQRKMDGNDIYCFFMIQKHPGNRMVCFTWAYDASINLQVTKRMKKWIFLQILMYIWRHFWPLRKFSRIFFRVQKKQGETCPKFKPSRFRKVLSLFFQKN